ncbi:MAG: Rne/Rng family ribonuclease, partial [Pseudomonadota bacterium]
GKYQYYKKYKVQEVLKRGQVLLIQVVKEERGNKGAALTTYISLAGRFCVVMPNSIHCGGVSRKISNADTRKRLKEFIAKLKLPIGTGLIIRTAGESCTDVEIERDYKYLIKLWENIKKRTFSSRAPSFIHAEGDLIRRCIRDSFDKSVKEIIIQGDSTFASVKSFVKMIAPNEAAKVKKYQGKVPLFIKFNIEEQLQKLYHHNVELPSGGYLVINHDEALTSIDINSGKSTSERNIESTALKTNLEAADEIARQLRLRDVGGLVVVDYIDMSDYRHRIKVEKAFKDALARDKARIQVNRISNLGLLEMSRQRLGSSFIEQHTNVCGHCQGRGVVRSQRSVAIAVIRSIECALSHGRVSSLKIAVHVDVMINLLNNYRHYLNDVENRYGNKLYFSTHQDNNIEKFKIDTVKKISAGPVAAVESFDDADAEVEAVADDLMVTEDDITSINANIIDDHHQVHLNNADRGVGTRKRPSRRNAAGGSARGKSVKSGKGDHRRQQRLPAGNTGNDLGDVNGNIATSNGNLVANDSSVVDGHDKSILKSIWKRIVD